MINPVNLNVVNNQYNKQNSQNSVLKPSFADTNNVKLSNYEVGQAILNRNNISFRNLAMPIEVTDKYNKKIEGKDHLDLPNIHVYEYPDTNLKVFVNMVDKNSFEPQYAIVIEPTDYNKYETLKQGLLNTIIESRLTKDNLEKFYSLEPPYTNLGCFITTDSETHLNMNEIPKINNHLTSCDFTEKELNDAKQKLINYINSEKYAEDNKMSLALYEDQLSSKKDVIKNLTAINLSELKSYQKNILQNSKINAYLTISDNDFNNKFFAVLNNNLNNKFMISDEKFYTKQKLNDKKIVLYNKDSDSNLKMNYFIDSQNLEDNIIASLFSKIFLLYADKNSQELENYINKLADKQNFSDIEEKKAYKLLLKERENQNFTTVLGHTYTNSVSEPFENFKNFDKKNLYGSYFEIYCLEDKQDCKNIDVLQELTKQKNIFNEILNTDFSDKLLQIKNDYKKNIKNLMSSENSMCIRNLSMTYFGNEIFQIYEVVDNIDQNDVKNFVKKYFLKQYPVIELQSIESNEKG